jgi:CarboxypepD_reg-like domain/Gram-negative bacterial TonB protein C-terminal
MANDNNIQLFTAADIEKYHKGLLSNKEMHDLEKAALDDPFLADALEGYTTPQVNVSADIISLKKRLAEKVEEHQQAKVIAINGGLRKPFPWLRAAAAVIIIAGAGLLANQFLFNKKETTEIAQAKPEAAKEKTTDTVSAELKTTTGGTTATPDATVENTPVQNNNTLATDKVNPSGNTSTKGIEETTTIPGKVATADKGVVAPITATNAPATQFDTEKEMEDAVIGKIENKDLKKQEELKRNTANRDFAAKEKTTNAEADFYKKEGTKPAAPARKLDEQNYRNLSNNVFRGRVTDANNVGVPFANVTNVEDKVGTYADANGNFNLTSPDSVLTVQVRSIGFENSQIQLRNQAPTSQIVLQDDRRSLSEVVISNQKTNVAARNRDANKTLQEPEPADGWDNYNAYAANNLEIPEEVKGKQKNSGAVEVSFEVDKNGEPVNIKVEKSLCAKCDEEAKRLIKEGPKWRRAASKKGRTTVTINF